VILVERGGSGNLRQ